MKSKIRAKYEHHLWTNCNFHHWVYRVALHSKFCSVEVSVSPLTNLTLPVSSVFSSNIIFFQQISTVLINVFSIWNRDFPSFPSSHCIFSGESLIPFKCSTSTTTSLFLKAPSVTSHAYSVGDENFNLTQMSKANKATCRSSASSVSADSKPSSFTPGVQSNFTE